MILINDAIDFDYAINQIIKNTSPTIHLQADVLNSENMNNSFAEIENTLNILYEKTRYLEDAIAYTKTFLETRISDFNNQVSSVLHEIENTVDAAKNLSYISYNVPFVENKRSIIDRDGITNLNPLIIKNKNLTLDYLLDENKEYNIWTRVADSIPYKDNINKIVSENYRTIYLEEKLQSTGMKETIYTYFEEPTLVNDLNIEPVNCVIQNLRFGLVNGLEDVIEFYNIDMPIAPRVCTYIKFDLVCTNYDYNVYTLDKQYVTDNVWSNVQEFEFEEITKAQTKSDQHLVISKTVTNSNTGKKNLITYAATDDKKTMALKMYSYIFGIDKFEIKNSEHYTDGYMISDPITIGHLEENEYIRLDVKHCKNDCCEISYSILDGDREIPIAIMNEDRIENELVFNNVDTRFEMNFDSVSEIIKKNGLAIDTNYIDAKDQSGQSNDRFCVSYFPSIDCYDYKPINKTIRVKCYIRTYGNVDKVPYISNITIRKYGEESLWINRF